MKITAVFNSKNAEIERSLSLFLMGFANPPELISRGGGDLTFTGIEFPGATVNVAVNHATEDGGFRHHGISIECEDPGFEAKVLENLISGSLGASAGDHIQIVDAKDKGFPANFMVSVSSSMFSPAILLHRPADSLPKK